MTNQEATQLIKKFAEPYLFPFAKELPEMEAARWIKLIIGMKLSVKETGEILTRFIASNPPRIKPDGCAAGTMPYIEDLKDFFEAQSTSQHKSCSCCDNTGWIFIERLNGVIPCKHTLPKEEVCVNFNCQPTEKHPCPDGNIWYNEKLIKFMREIKKDPKYQKGLEILEGIEKKRCKPSNIAKILTQEIRDIPEAGEY